MSTININSVVSYYNTGTKSTSGTKGVSGYSSATAAKNAAKAAATTAADSVGGGTPASGGSSSTTDLKFGSNFGGVSKTIGTPGSSMDPDEGTYEGWCSYSSSRTSTMYQLKLVFTIPTGLTAANISGASISFTAQASHTAETEYRVCAPKTTSAQTNYQKYSETTIIDTSNYVSFTAPGNTNAKTYSLVITGIFKQCITNGQGWVTILLPSDTAGGNRIMTLSGTPQITYTENYSACGAPTSVSCGTAIQKPGGTVSISWSGATAGTNNSIAGYTIYYNTGSAPTTSSSSVNVTSSPYSFTIPSNATRGTTYYFKVLTRGSVSGYNSGISSAQAATKVNSLPNAPTASASPTRIKSTGSTTVTFTVTAGATNDTGQTASLYYATSATGTKTVFTSPLKPSLSAAATYYFWTYDGLEYSSSYASQSIIKNTPPTISSITMSAYNNTTYSPSKDNRSYVKNINGSASGVTGTSLSYQWKLCVGSGTGASSYGTVTNISTATSLSNIDVTSYGATFNTAYRLALTVTDDLGESATAYSSTVYVIPAAPTISSIYNQKGSGNKGGNTNNSHFEDGIRINYNENNTGLTRELQYSTSSNFSSFTAISLSGTSYSDVTLSSLNRGTTYYFRVKYTCNTKTTTSAVSSGYMRANDITPNISAITPQSGSAIKPYTQSVLNFTFTNSPISWAAEQDVATSYGAIYSIKLKYSTRSLNVTSSDTGHSSGTVTGTVTLSSISNTYWKTLLGITDAPNTSYLLTLEITATNGFGTTFIGSKTFTANFVEGIYSIGTPELRIKTGSSTYTKIPSSYNNQTTTSRYHIFETQVLQLSLTGLQCYANQTATIYFMNGTTQLGSVAVAANEWSETNTSGTSFRYTLNGSKTINYTVPQNTVATDSSNVRNYSVKVVLANGSSKLSTDSGQSNGNLNTCYHSRFAPSSINFSLSGVTESGWTWSCTDWGSIGSSSNKYSGDYSSVKAQFKTSNRADSGYSNLGSQQTLTPSNGSGTINQSLSSITYDIIYCGVTITLALNFQTIDSATPTGTTTYTYTYFNLFTFYRATPNILYGKNFFALNQNKPIEGRSDQLLEISTARDTSVNPEVTRDKIYFGTDGTNFQITGNGLVIDCGSWS